MNRLKDTHDAERAQRGWSRYDVLGGGIDNSILVPFAEALKKVEGASPEQKQAAEQIAFMRDDEEFYASPKWDAMTFEEQTNYERLCAVTARRGLFWVSKNPQVLDEVVLFSQPARKVLGESLVEFGSYEDAHSVPGVAPYAYHNFDRNKPEESRRILDEASKRWQSDCRWVGNAILTGSDTEQKVALAWLAVWYGHLWD